MYECPNPHSPRPTHGGSLHGIPITSYLILQPPTYEVTKSKSVHSVAGSVQDRAPGRRFQTRAPQFCPPMCTHHGPNVKPISHCLGARRMHIYTALQESCHDLLNLFAVSTLPHLLTVSFRKLQCRVATQVCLHDAVLGFLVCMRAETGGVFRLSRHAKPIHPDTQHPNVRLRA